MVQIKQPVQAVRREGGGQPVGKPTCATDVEMTASGTGTSAKDARDEALKEARAAAAGACEGKSCGAGIICGYFEKKVVGTVSRIVPAPTKPTDPTHSATVTSIGACECP